MREAKRENAHVAHFPEACLSGYAGPDRPTPETINWNELRAYTEALMRLCSELKLWLVLGSTHRLSAPNKPHNCLYIVGPDGNLVDRYDKRFCAGDAGENTGDLGHYTPGDHSSVFSVNGICCGAQICHDYRYPELYRAYKRLGVQVMFHSFHAARVDAEQYRVMQEQVGLENHSVNRGTTYPEITMPSSMIAAAASSHMWISCPNSAAQTSCWGSFFVRADGVITAQLPNHATGLFVSDVDPDAPLYDSTRIWRDRALSGILHSGTLVDDARSRNRTAL